MNSDMVKPEKFGHLHLVYHFAVPLRQIEWRIQNGSITNGVLPVTTLFLSKILFQFKDFVFKELI